jgi:RimJ/RimL family protein N-acetyltransferase
MPTTTIPLLEVPAPPLADDVIVLRPFADADADQLTQACQDPLIQKFIPIPRPYTGTDATAYIDRTKAQWVDGSKAAFAIARADDPAIVLGAINVAIFEAVGNAGYWVAPHARGQGIATRALFLLTDWVFDQLGLGVLLLEIRPDNPSSLHVAHTVGFHDAGQIDVNTQTGERFGRILVRLASDRRTAS